VCQIFPPNRSSKVIQTQRPIGAAKHKIRGEVLRIPQHQPVDGLMVEGGKFFYKPEKWLVCDSQPEGGIHLLDGSHLPIVWREGLLQVFKSMDALGLHNGDLQKQLQLGRNNFKAI
jgi:hypothetical protein